jgi:hypothetical protein
MILNTVENCIFKDQRIQVSLKLRIPKWQLNRKSTRIKIYSQPKKRFIQIIKSIIYQTY